jgi:cyclic beta-1,2-glucan synthetase
METTLIDMTSSTGSKQQLDAEILSKIENAARAAARWDVVYRPVTRCTFPERVHAARAALMQLEVQLAQMPAVKPGAEPVEPQRAALIELRANPRVLRSAIQGLSGHRSDIPKLPRVVDHGRPDEPRVAVLAAAYLHAVDGDFSAATLSAFIRTMQTQERLTVGELWNLAGLVKFVLTETLVAEAKAALLASNAASASLLSVHFKSLRSIANLDLVYLIEPLIAFDAVLKQDPAAAYETMDFESRAFYRKRVAFVARHSDRSEFEVAESVLQLARKGSEESAADPRVQLRRRHVGYYLFEAGFSQLADLVGFHPPLSFRMRSFVREHGDDFYVIGIQLLTVLFIAAIIFPVLPHFSGILATLVALIFLFPPVMQDAVELVNFAITSFFEPDLLPKLDFGTGIPATCTTLVAVPTLLLNEKQVRGLVMDMEVRYLANRDPHLHFALLTDLADSVSRPLENDSHPLVELASRLIDELNARYAAKKCGSFILLHRHRIFNTRQGVWMGWERKRGKLLDLNKLLRGEFDAFPLKAGGVDALRQVRYVLTLDSDTQLPRGAAAKLAGAIAHPLNQAIIDPNSRIVISGYGILQPRIGITVESASRSRLAAIYSGPTGFDIYSRAISDAYQDLFGEGIFTGKGIYEVAAVHTVLDRRFPRNALLSHDLIEGAYSRAGLVSDIELIDDYPSHFRAYSSRKHRWVRGDWQILQWLFTRVPDESGKWVRNPVSGISRWKIFDNLRRSLVDPFLVFLLVAGWLGLPGGPIYWTAISLVLMIFPGIVQLGFGLGRAFANRQPGGVSDAFFALWRSELMALLQLTFLFHQLLLSLDAIVRSLIRRFITGERLLEWETAAQAELQSSNRALIDQYLALIGLAAAGIAAMVWFLAHDRRAIYCAVPFLLLWSMSKFVAAWLNRPVHEKRHLDPAEKEFLLRHAIRIWRYFYDFSSKQHNYLIPDNVEEDGLREAARVSPTNIGLLLNARQAACELGFITIREFAELTGRTLASISALDKYRGHLYNWYDTETLKALNAAPFVSSVDSGNFVASLYTLSSGTRELTKKPVLPRHLFTGLRAYFAALNSVNGGHASAVPANLPSASAPFSEWISWLPNASEASFPLAPSSHYSSDEEFFKAEIKLRAKAILALVHDYLPWMLPEYASLRTLPYLHFDKIHDALNIQQALSCAGDLDIHLATACSNSSGTPSMLQLCQQLREALAVAIRNLRTLANNLREIAQFSEQLAEETEFNFLVDPGRQILSIGYDVKAEQLHDACYDMIASEARIATFLAIARGDISQQSWFKLSREHAHAFGRFLLLSWTGTMFEYLMPALWMRSYPGTMLSRSQSAAVHVQRDFARTLSLPWGISESGAAGQDDQGHYQYKAYGVPDVALWFEAEAGPVISPYSTFLALVVDAKNALGNLRGMESAKWVGPYGFYEAADYTASRRSPVLVREWMAHHQGMSLLAILNLLHENIAQEWFHANPIVQANESLLHELSPAKAVLKARQKEFAPLHSAK